MNTLIRLLGAATLLMSAGCAATKTLMPTPNLYVGSDVDPFEHVAPALRTSYVDVLYATGRAPEDGGGDANELRYGSGRSDSLAFGRCRVQIGGGDLTWHQLVAASLTRERSGDFTMSVAEIEELGRFPPTPLTIREVDGKLETAPDELAERGRTAGELREELRTLLELTPRREVFVFVHGFNNSFDDAVMEVAEMWHFLGREGVPIAYAWPSSGDYAYDRESGEFTVYHLKQFLGVLASVPELRSIHILAHSRGTDVATTALREMFIETRGAGRDPLNLKIANLVLAAPDLDFDVVRQRLAAERVDLGIRRLTIYVSVSDKALGASSWLFASRRRLGQLRVEDLEGRFAEMLQLDLQASMIDARVSSTFFGHDYFHSNPAVSSDLILILRDDRDPGADNGRPLRREKGSYWVITDAYPAATEGSAATSQGR